MKNKEILLKALHKAIDHSSEVCTKNSLGFTKPSKKKEEYELRRFGAKLRIMCVNNSAEEVALELNIKAEEVKMFLELPELRIADVK